VFDHNNHNVDEFHVADVGHDGCSRGGGGLFVKSQGLPLDSGSNSSLCQRCLMPLCFKIPIDTMFSEFGCKCLSQTVSFQSY
jgi:hypothetical protein